MPTISQFFEEINEIFGFYYDIGFANSLAETQLNQIQEKYHAADDSPFMYRSGPPTETPEIEAENANHSTTISRLKERIKKDGFNQQKAAEAALIIIYLVWEEKYRNKLIRTDGTTIFKNNSDIFGDIRHIRNSIIHNKGIANQDMVKCKVFKRFTEGQKIILSNTDIDFIVAEIRRDFTNY